MFKKIEKAIVRRYVKKQLRSENYKSNILNLFLMIQFTAYRELLMSSHSKMNAEKIFNLLSQQFDSSQQFDYFN